MNRCLTCGCWDSDLGCTMPSIDMWYACPIEAEKPENQRALVEWIEEMKGEKTWHQKKTTSLK